ncbi:heme lyase CcmF/NrfE family subunit [Motiliproteus sp. MSK22-1]|uniref:heme lyase CcmF/NrfE family subunit n=1 Tax=Motiliproteus sp. MSK22-1 TaxID=1897630 RepID=UPI00097890A0|nr:heme lyase CcmF/NrfE family subunit [Motiliproteus sp. MSK22-1]OMH32171.1 c-type cytochrome biogenesis protein CcmF [Motiliproteus sp. MSK22-1]
MIPELGHLALILAFCFFLVLAIVPLIGASTANDSLMSYARPLTWGMFLFLSCSFGALFYAFLTDDFSVKYVANHSNTHLPTAFKASAVWGGHEGSLLLWLWILGAWTFAVSILSGSMPKDVLARVLAVMGMNGIGFSLFILMTSNPFDRYLPNFPAEGADLNPLLQDFGLVVHPPMLYMGYVGFSVAFAFAIAALMSGRLDAAWARWSRPWTTVAWAFLTLGIALGSWWAYYELGWGGWWFWDPVENASFMPWLVGTALIHSLAVTEKRGVFKSWTLLLAIFAFSLSLLGTFLVRSGVLTSVHAFASDPSRGFFVLVLLAITVGGSLLLYALKAPSVRSESSFSLVSRESFLLLNNIILVVVCLTVLLGTLYPLFADALGLGKISVGPPYFNTFFIPFMSILSLLMGIGMVARWKNTKGSHLSSNLLVSALLSILAAFSLPYLYHDDLNWGGALGAGLMAWIVLVVVKDLLNKITHKKNKWLGLKSLSRSYYGMMLAHVGVGVTIVGIAMVSIYDEARDLRMDVGDQVTMGNYTFVFRGTSHVTGPNFVSDQALIDVLKDGEPYSQMHPEKRVYNAQRSMMTEAAIDPGLFRDLYVALGEPLEGTAWAVRVQHKPFIRWIWLGAIFMTVGGLLAASDPRYRRKKQKVKTGKASQQDQLAVA